MYGPLAATSLGVVAALLDGASRRELFAAGPLAPRYDYAAPAFGTAPAVESPHPGKDPGTGARASGRGSPVHIVVHLTDGNVGVR